MASAPICINCVTGFKLPGTPKGNVQKLGPYDTYIAGNGGSHEKAIVLFTDAFGLGLDNNKIIADMIAERTGFPVFVPDLFNGKPAPADAIKMPGSVTEAKKQSFFSRISTTVTVMLTLGPWIYRNWPTSKYNDVESFIKVLRTEKNVQRLGAVGYCYGGKLAVEFNTRGKLDVSVLCHPSLTSNASYDNLKAPILFNCAEEDDQFPPKMREQVRQKLDKDSNAPKHDFHVYEDCVHGFAARPDLSNEKVKKGFEGALESTIGWFTTHL